MLCDKRAGGCGKAFCYVCETDWQNIHKVILIEINIQKQLNKKKQIQKKYKKI